MNQPGEDERWMRRALELARCAEQEGEVPVGAVLVDKDGLIAESWNRPISSCDPTAHAEILVLREAARIKQNYRLPDTTLYVTLEPCPMCAGALIHARVQRVVYGAQDPRSGAAGSVFDLLQSGRLNHRCKVDHGVLKAPCGAILTTFFQNKR